jgi:tRNA nucleotidyltransferase (CCA-adding enzyme)
MHLPKAVLYVLDQITAAGGQAFLVGGALRDHLLGRAVTDYDIAASLSPDRIEEVFAHEKTYPTGKRFGTITVAAGGLSFEVTTFRVESGYSDSRHPDEVTFVSDIVSDLSRRDFTINAMAYNPRVDSGFIDPFLGMEDLKKGMIRAVGLPRKRFEEDPLRMLRGIRFAAQLDFRLEEETKQAVSECKPLLKYVSRERIRDELIKLLLSPHPDKGILLLQATGVLPILLSVKTASAQASPDEIISDEIALGTAALTEKELQIIKSAPEELDYRLAALLYMLLTSRQHNLTEQCVPPSEQLHTMHLENILEGLRLDRKCIHHVICLVKGYLQFCSMEITPYQMRKLIGELGVSDTRHMLNWYKAAHSVLPENGGMENKYAAACQLLDVILEQKDPVFRTDLAINGYDVLKAGIGIKDGRLVGEALNLAYDWVLKDPARNHAENLLSALKRQFSTNNEH